MCWHVDLLQVYYHIPHICLFKTVEKHSFGSIAKIFLHRWWTTLRPKAKFQPKKYIIFPYVHFHDSTFFVLSIDMDEWEKKTAQYTKKTHDNCSSTPSDRYQISACLFHLFPTDKHNKTSHQKPIDSNWKLWRFLCAALACLDPRIRCRATTTTRRGTGKGNCGCFCLASNEPKAIQSGKLT